MKVAINGFGRIGRGFLKAVYETKGVEIVAINDLTSTDNLAYLLKHDSIQSKFNGNVAHTKDSLVINKKKIPVYAEKDPALLPWKKHKVDVVVECTGFFRTREKASLHLKAGAKRVLISAPAKGDAPVPTYVKAVNCNSIKRTDDIICIGSCTTNSLAPPMKVLHDAFGIKKALFTTIHAYTGNQRLIDAPHKDFRRGRSAGLNIVPTTTGAAISVEKAFPAVKGKMQGIAVRVPVAVGSLTDLTCELNKDVTANSVNAVFKKAASGPMKGVLEYCTEPIVSSDVVGNNHSSIFDAAMTHVTEKRLVKILCWYDNETGFSHRMVDIIKKWVK